MDKAITLYDWDSSGTITTTRFQTMVANTSSSQSAAITSNRILITSTAAVDGSGNGVAVYVAFGSNPTATTSSFLLPPGGAIFNFFPGWKVAAITSSQSTRISIIDID